MNEGPKAFRRLLAKQQFFVAPGVHDMLSALIAERVGFSAIYMTGYGTSLSQLGLPDAGLATYSDFVDRAARLSERISAPIIADADTGFGGLINVQHTIRGYEMAGVAAIQIEDQEFPKRCGHTPGKRVVSLNEMVLRIRVAVDNRRNSDFCIIARTDARAELGLDEALRRAEAYVKAGADILFVEAPQSREELATIGKSFDVPLMANMNPGPTLTPELSAGELAEMGYAFSIYPGITMLPAAAAMMQELEYLKEHKSAVELNVPMVTLADLHQISGFPEVWAFEKRYAALAEALRTDDGRGA
jgi:2-methylisocitrate lyase-like PEP mutase family enzyme